MYDDPQGLGDLLCELHKKKRIQFFRTISLENTFFGHEIVSSLFPLLIKITCSGEVRVLLKKYGISTYIFFSLFSLVPSPLSLFSTVVDICFSWFVAVSLCS